MYCRNCGHKLAEGDKFCSSCGEKAILTSESDTIVKDIEGDAVQPQADDVLEKSEPLFEPFDFKALGLDLGFDTEPQTEEPAPEEPAKPAAPVEEFDWNIHTFPGRGVEKTEDVDFNWSMSPDEVAEPEPQTPAPEPEIITPEEPKWNVPETEHKAPESDAAPASTLEEELFGGLDSKTDEARKQSEEIDKFFTFHKKNEEFQKLLDQEYEKIKSGNILTEEMNTAVAASEEKFASRQSEDPMEDLFAAEGVVKGYEPKPVETDVLERIEAVEAEKKAREEAKRIIEEEKAKAAAEEAEKAAQEAKEAARIKAEEEAARVRLAEEAKRAADAKAAEEAAERERARMAARAEAEAAIKEAEEKAAQARAEAEAKLAEQTALLQAEAEARAKAEAEEKAKAEAAARAAVEQDPSSHISEMVRARETFFGQELSLEAQQPEEESVPEKTKAVDKAAILAGMATASEMVQRDRAAAAARAAEEAAMEAAAAAEPEEAEETVELPDFLGHMEEMQPEEAAPEELVLEPEDDILQQLQEITAQEDPEEIPQEDVISETEEPVIATELEEIQGAEVPEENPAELFSVEDLLGAEEPVSVQPEETETEAEPEVSRETLIMTEDSVAELLNGQAASEENNSIDETMIFPADFNPAEEIKEEADSAEHPEEADNETDDEYEEEEKGGKGRLVLKICLVVLILLLVMEIAGVVIKVAAPNSGAASFIDTQLNKVIHLFTGDDSEEYSLIANAEDIRQQPMEDKTQLIKAEMGKNKDGNIQSIEYNADLKFDPEKKYENTDLNLTQNLADVTWYKNAANKQVYYDQAIVGTMIAYDSQKVNMINNNDASVLNLMKEDTDLYNEVKELGTKGMDETFDCLQIGEIRQAGSSYYVWVAEKTQNSLDGNSDTKKIYQMEPQGETMKIVASYEA